MTSQMLPITTHECQTTCDRCGTSSFTAMARCPACARDVCNDCCHWDNRDHGDYPTRFCTACWETGTSHRQAIEKEQDRSYAETERLEVEWYKKCAEDKT